MAKYKVRVYHGYYGCDTGCCGHYVDIEDEEGKSRTSRMTFDHPYGEEFTVWARELAEEAIRENWPDCLESIDWSSLEIDVSDD